MTCTIGAAKDGVILLSTQIDCNSLDWTTIESEIEKFAKSNRNDEWKKEKESEHVMRNKEEFCSIYYHKDVHA